MRLWKKWLAGLFVLSFCFTGVSCSKKKVQDSRFGMDINQLNPLVMNAEDCATGETVFSRDASIISEVTALYQNMKLTPAEETSDQKGISFTVSTMYGNFAFGECMGSRLRLDGKEYTLDKDYSENLRLLYDRLKSETENTAAVSAGTILSIKPDMTYRQIMDTFGSTLLTAAEDGKKAYLYQYRGRPFYILFDEETDTVGMTGEQLIESIWNNYNLGQDLSAPDELEGGRLSVYEQAFDAVADRQKSQSDNKFMGIVLNTKKLVHLNDDERQELIRYLREKYSVPVEDDPQTERFAFDDTAQPDKDKLILWIDQYSYIGDSQMNFVVAGRLEGQAAVKKQMEIKLVNNEWRG